MEIDSSTKLARLTRPLDRETEALITQSLQCVVTSPRSSGVKVTSKLLLTVLDEDDHPPAAAQVGELKSDGSSVVTMEVEDRGVLSKVRFRVK